MTTDELVIEDAEVEEIRNLPAVQASEAMVVRGEVTPEEVVGQRDKIKQVMEAVMHEGIHYGRIPGITKPTLLKPGAEVLAVTFRLAPSYRSERIFEGDDLTVISQATLTHIQSGFVIAEGEGLCSTRETKYRYRQAERVCPACGTPAIIKGKEQYGGGWVCFKKKGGCGEKFADGDQVIESQEQGRVENDSLPDVWNTVLKMANKRALVAAVLNGTAASDIFTQDVEDVGPAAAESHDASQSQPKPEPKKKYTAADFRQRIRERAVEADAKRGETKTAAEVETAFKNNWDTSLDKASEEQLEVVGKELKQWLDGGCSGPFELVPF